MRDEIMAVKKEIENLKEQSFAMEMLKDSKSANKRMAFCYTLIIIIIFISQVVETIYLIDILNETNTTVETTSQEFNDVTDVSGNITNGGDINGYNKTN